MGESWMNNHWHYREKVYIAGDYMEIDIIPAFGLPRRRRRQKSKETTPKQRNLNDKNARRHLTRLVHANFDLQHDYMITLTYDAAVFYPSTIKEAESVLKSFLRRINRESVKQGKGRHKYIAVSEQGAKGNIHHHLILSNHLDRNTIEDLWCIGRGHKRQRIGRANCRRLQADNEGVVGLTHYITKASQKGQRRWRQSRGLTPPVVMEKHNVYTKRGLMTMHHQGKLYDAYYWQSKNDFKGWFFTSIDVVNNKENDLSYYYVKMRR